MRYARHPLNAALVLMLVWVVVVTLSSAAQAAAAPVAVTITDSNVKFSRTALTIGTVVFVVTNHAKRRHDFRVAGNATPDLAPGHSATLKIVFTRGGSYRYVVPGLRTGVLRVTGAAVAGSPTVTTTVSAQPCASPTTSTVTVTMTDIPGTRGYAFSPSTVPCGTVTFILKDVGSGPHGFGLMDPLGVILPSSQTVQPSQTAGMTANLKYVGSYQWVDTVAGEFGEADVSFLAVRD